MSNSSRRASEIPISLAPPPSRAGRDLAFYIRRHLQFGWWALLVFLTLGIVLEVLHGFKVPAYLNPSNSTRRLMWTLAHAHGTLLALINIAFAVTVSFAPGWDGRQRDFASACLRSATILLPAGFFLGGVKIYGGDPGLGILLVPLGAVLLLLSVFLAARGARSLTAPVRYGEMDTAKKKNLGK